jgi:hypothetical protein
MLIILILSHLVWAQEPLLEGIWSQPCQNQALRTENFARAQVTLTESYYGDKNCAKPVMDFESAGTYTADRGEIDFAFQKISITVQDFWYMADYNNRHVCGIDTWEMGVAQDVTGKFCEIFGKGYGIQIPPAGQKRFGIYKIENDQLYFGKLSVERDSSSPEKRPTEFDPRFYVRTK